MCDRLNAVRRCGAGGAAVDCGLGRGGTMSMPKPMRKVKRSRSVIARFAGSVSSSGPSSRFNTWRSASSGNSPSTGSSSRSLHSSTRIIAAAAVTGFVIEAMRKDCISLSRIAAAQRLHTERFDRFDMRLAAPADQRDEAGHLATFDITGHHVVQAGEARVGQTRRTHPPSNTTGWL
jgi:hypothetical protein